MKAKFIYFFVLAACIAQASAELNIGYFLSKIDQSQYQIIADWNKESNLKVTDLGFRIRLQKNIPVKINFKSPINGRSYINFIFTQMLENQATGLHFTAKLMRSGVTLRYFQVFIPNMNELVNFDQKMLTQMMELMFKDTDQTIISIGYGFGTAINFSKVKKCLNSICPQMKGSDPTIFCGNSLIQKGEQCDNGRRLGCTYCTVEPGYTCSGSPSLCTLCGDGIKTPNEQCDNGRKPGCLSCTIQAGWRCFGNVYGTSVCIRQPACGNLIVDAGQQCDNGNKPGCQVNCRIDAGYKCINNLGQTSVCSKCGNYLVESGEECDNGNNEGCYDCRKQPGWECRGVSNSQCYRANPSCGNGVIQIAEGCDDGNRKSGDGCNSSCIVEDGYKCYGDLGQKSVCYY